VTAVDKPNLPNYSPGAEVTSQGLNAHAAATLALWADMERQRRQMAWAIGFLQALNRQARDSMNNLTQLATIPPRR
jgi:hypothetical protein